jgi:hypothetical protein
VERGCPREGRTRTFACRASTPPATPATDSERHLASGKHELRGEGPHDHVSGYQPSRDDGFRPVVVAQRIVPNLSDAQLSHHHMQRVHPTGGQLIRPLSCWPLSLTRQSA